MLFYYAQYRTLVLVTICATIQNWKISEFGIDNHCDLYYNISERGTNVLYQRDLTGKKDPMPALRLKDIFLVIYKNKGGVKMLWSPQRNSSYEKRSASDCTRRRYWQRSVRRRIINGLTECRAGNRLYRAVDEAFAPALNGKGSGSGEKHGRVRVN
jgi:hypothetical protein